jgi:hypothetical protein
LAKFIIGLLVSCLVAVGTAAWAHGGGEHVLGTVTAIDGGHIEVKTLKGGTVSVRLTDKTQFLAKGEVGARGGPQVGDRVVIETTKDGEMLTATEVRFSRPKGK